MSRRLALTVVLLALATAPSLAAAPTRAARFDWNARVLSSWRVARAAGVPAGVAVIDEHGRVHSRNGRERFRSASTVKVMLMTCYLRDAAHRSLRRRDRGLLEPMIHVSDNAAASRVFAIVGEACVRRVARLAGMPRTRASFNWANTRITPIGGAELMYHLAALLPRRHRAYALALLAHVVGYERWGFFRYQPRGWYLGAKGGWRRNDVHQFALARAPDGRRLALAVMTASPSVVPGEALVTRMARRLLSKVR
jgi:beta-lactamase class A